MKVSGVGQPIGIRHEYIFEVDVCILRHPGRHLALDLRIAETLAVFFHYEALDLATIIDVLGPDDIVVSIGALAHPSFVTVQDEAAWCFTSDGQRIGSVGPSRRLR